MTDSEKRNRSPVPRDKEQSPARSKRRSKKGAPDPRERRDHIRDIMASNQWESRRTPYRLAQEWGVGVDTVNRSAAEASRLLEISPEELPAIRDRLLSGLESIIARCTTKRSPRYREAIRAIEVLANITGANAPQKVEVSGTLGDLLTLGLEGSPGGQGTDPEVEDGPTSVRPGGAGDPPLG